MARDDSRTITSLDSSKREQRRSRTPRRMRIATTCHESPMISRDLPALRAVITRSHRHCSSFFCFSLQLAAGQSSRSIFRPTKKVISRVTRILLDTRGLFRRHLMASRCPVYCLTTMVRFGDANFISRNVHSCPFQFFFFLLLIIGRFCEILRSIFLKQLITSTGQ